MKNLLHYFMIQELNQKLSQIEGKRKPAILLSQKILILHELGMLAVLESLNIPQKSKKKILSLLLDSHEKNIEQDLNLLTKGKVSKLYNKTNIEFLRSLYLETHLDEHYRNSDIMLDQYLSNRV